MSQTLAVWVVVALGLVTANLPFVVQRRFLILPWAQAGECAGFAGVVRFLLSLVFFAALVLTGYYAFQIVGQAFFVPSDLVSTALFLAKLVAAFLVVVGLLSLAGLRQYDPAVQKSFIVRLLELLVFYAFTGVLGFALELNIGNMFSQRWEFYAITFSLFVVMGYPGFVYRYLMRHPKPPKPKKTASAQTVATA